MGDLTALLRTSRFRLANYVKHRDKRGQRAKKGAKKKKKKKT